MINFTKCSHQYWRQMCSHTIYFVLISISFQQCAADCCLPRPRAGAMYKEHPWHPATDSQGSAHEWCANDVSHLITSSLGQTISPVQPGSGTEGTMLWCWHWPAHQLLLVLYNAVTHCLRTRDYQHNTEPEDSPQLTCLTQVWCMLVTVALIIELIVIL